MSDVIQNPTNNPDCQHWALGVCQIGYKKHPTYRECRGCDQRQLVALGLPAPRVPPTPVKPTPEVKKQTPPKPKPAAKPIAEMTLPEKTRHLVKGVKRRADALLNLEPVSLNVLQQRQGVCNTCEHGKPDHKPLKTKCTFCGCALPAKQKLARESCPVGKWPAVEPLAVDSPPSPPTAAAVPPTFGVLYVGPPAQIQKQHLLIEHSQCPGDILVLTAAVRDLVLSHGDHYKVGVKTNLPELWENNPYIVPESELHNPRVVKADYGRWLSWANGDCRNKLNQRPVHFIEAYIRSLETQLGLKIPVTDYKPEVFLSDAEKNQPPVIAGKYWVVMAGGKYDFTAKWWDPDYFQEVVDHFAGKIQFVQCGNLQDWHPTLRNVIDMRNKTPRLRDYIKLMYHAEGVLCPVTFAMHLAAALPTKSITQTRPDKQGQPVSVQVPVGPVRRACVVIAGGRELPSWESYPGHQYLHTIGALKCCATSGCWMSKAAPGKDGNTTMGRCHDIVTFKRADPILPSRPLQLAKCMTLITPEQVMDAIDLHYQGGILQYANKPAAALPVTPIQVAAKPPAQPGHQFLFVGGMHRSGTTALWNAFKHHSQISGFHKVNIWMNEGQFEQKIYPIDRALGDMAWPLDPQSHMTEDHPLATNDNKQLLFKQWSRHWDLQKPWLLEKTPRNLVMGRWLQAMMPGPASFLFVVRHPVAVAKAVNKAWNTRFTFQQLVEFWVAGNEICVTDLPHLHNAAVIRYDDFVKAPTKNFDICCQVLGLPAEALNFKISPNNNDKYLTPWKTELAQLQPDIRSWAENLEPRVRNLGYSLLEPDWRPEAECQMPYVRL
jgi:hypothetical protein